MRPLPAEKGLAVIVDPAVYREHEGQGRGDEKRAGQELCRAAEIVDQAEQTEQNQGIEADFHHRKWEQARQAPQGAHDQGINGDRVPLGEAGELPGGQLEQSGCEQQSSPRRPGGTGGEICAGLKYLGSVVNAWYTPSFAV